MTMSRIGCAPPATPSQTPSASSIRRAAGRDREGALVAVRIAPERRDRTSLTSSRVAERLLQRQRQRQPGNAAARDDDPPRRLRWQFQAGLGAA